MKPEKDGRKMHNQPASSAATKRRRTDAGYLLVEVLVTASLLLVGLLAILPMFTMAMRQNAYAKDMAHGSASAMQTIEDFNRTQCDLIRRGTCCTFDGPSCAPETWQLDGITYKRTCHVRTGVADLKYATDSDAALDKFPVEGIAWVQVTVEPIRGSHFGDRAVKPAVNTFWKECQED